MIHLSQAAANEIQRLKASRQKTDSYFRLGVEPGGCSGLYYILDLCAMPLKGDLICESQGISMVINEQSIPYLQDLKLDFAEDLMGGSFRFQNPKATATCGCALSFACAT
ncbi:iron-sulfur cluster assembly accessory protein [Candidatus Gracilibacteria bacterium]|nr:iron-sulfur cluster assembly accessory protein [Candidatus Gracilibacteria bacterium]NJP21264.1 iron-sulfur cluster assembly accessory protein [Hydrococcus sp. CRU_1_1]NJQ97602.1 iron-sulfur cluster assembly accessory protein [Hydrococcus sp. CSU_1_8]